jgi:hypothetical protein
MEALALLLQYQEMSSLKRRRLATENVPLPAKAFEQQELSHLM